MVSAALDIHRRQVERPDAAARVVDANFRRVDRREKAVAHLLIVGLITSLV